MHEWKYPDCRKECSLWIAQSHHPFRQAGETILKSVGMQSGKKTTNYEDF